MSKPQTNTIQYKHIQSQEWEGSMKEMERILGGANPPAVDDAGKAYKDAASKFNASVDVLRKQAAALANVWKGKDADEAQKQMQRLHASAREIGYRSGQTGVALTDHAEKLQWYKDHAPKAGFMEGFDWGDVEAFRFGGLAGVAAKQYFCESKEDKAAQEHMNRLQGRTVEANGYMPEDITTDLPDPGQSIWRPEGRPPGGHPPGGMPGGGMPGGGMPGGGGNLPKDPFGNGGPGGGGNLPKDPFGNGGPGGGGNLPKDPFGNGGGGGGTELAGMPHGPGGAGSGLGGDPFGKGGLGGGGAGGGLGGGLGGGPGGLSGGAPGMPGGLGGGAPGTGAGRGVGGRGAGGMGGAPMGGGAGGGGKGGEEEHERSTWLTEDEDVWGGNDGDTAPPVIG
jgi:uncharacterized protein YukE